MALVSSTALIWQLFGIICITIGVFRLSDKAKESKIAFFCALIFYLVQICLLIYYGSFEGAFNFSGHGSCENVPNWLFYMYAFVGFLSAFLWILHFVLNKQQSKNA